MAKRESQFQRELIEEIEDRLPGCIVMKNDPTYIQGIPDLIILYKTRWAALEVKRCAQSHHQPNQDYYISIMDEMSFASFICPENKEEIIDAMEQSLLFER